MFFGQTFRWQPSEINELRWLDRKEIKEAWLDKIKEEENKSKNK